MSIVTYDVAQPTDITSKRATLFARLLDRFVEARMERALYEINRHRHLFDRSHRIAAPERSELPFGR
jgi:hypothetical protein